VEWLLAQTIKAAASAKVPQHLKLKVTDLLHKGRVPAQAAAPR